MLCIVTAIDWINAVHHHSKVPRLEGNSFAKVPYQESYMTEYIFVNCAFDIPCIAISARKAAQMLWRICLCIYVLVGGKWMVG